MLIITVNISIMSFSDFLNPFSIRRRQIHEAIRQDIEDSRNNEEIRRKEIESNISKGLVPYIKRKGIFVSCLDSNGLINKNSAAQLNIKWLNPKIMERVNQTLMQVKTVKKEYKLKRKANMEEFKIKRDEIKANYKGEIDILKSASKRIIKTGHPYLI
jgi:hypothetical protein